MVREVGDDEVEDKESLAVGGNLKRKFQRADGIFDQRGAASFFKQGGDGFNLEMKGIERTGIEVAAKNPRGFFAGVLG